jgi:hypothetical protein
LNRPVEIAAEEQLVVVKLSSLRLAWKLRKRSISALLPLLRGMKREKLALRLQIGSQIDLAVLPRPALVLRLLVPQVNSIVSEDLA